MDKYKSFIKDQLTESARVKNEIISKCSGSIIEAALIINAKNPKIPKKVGIRGRLLVFIKLPFLIIVSRHNTCEKAHFRASRARDVDFIYPR